MLEIWNNKYKDGLQVFNGNTLYKEYQWVECDNLVGRLLSTAAGGNKMADCYVAQSYLDLWRTTWSLINQYFLPTGNKAMTLQEAGMSALWRRTNESFELYVKS